MKELLVFSGCRFFDILNETMFDADIFFRKDEVTFRYLEVLAQYIGQRSTLLSKAKTTNNVLIIYSHNLHR